MGTWAAASKPGDSAPEIPAAKKILEHVASTYAKGVDDGTPFYTERFGQVLREYGTRVNASIAKGTRATPKIPTPGVFDWATKVQLGIIPRAASPAPAPVKLGHRHFLSSPGSGADWWIGPSFEVGERLKKEAGVQHWPLGYPKGGYAGLMGGDPGQSYIETIQLEDAELERRIEVDVLTQYGIFCAGRAVTVEDVKKLPSSFGIIPSGYSQSADGIIRACARLFGAGGRFELLRPFLRAILCFGNPARQGGPTRYGRNPVGKGISGFVAEPWLAALIVDIITESPMAPDFYACCTSKIARSAYTVVVHAEIGIDFVVYLSKIIIPAMLRILTGGLAGGGAAGGGILGGILGGVVGNAAVPLIASVSGMAPSLLTPIVAGSMGAGDEPPQELLDMLSVQGLLTSMPELLGLLLALPGIQTHGEYHLPKPEFGGRTGIDVGFDQIRPLV